VGHPFAWVPAENARHATRDPKPPDGFPAGEPVRTLCGQNLPAAAGPYAWFWDTCTGCHAQARHLLDERAARP